MLIKEILNKVYSSQLCGNLEARNCSLLFASVSTKTWDNVKPD